MTLHSRPRAPWIVGRTPLLEHAAADFLNEVTRQTPWRRARYEALLGALEAWLEERGSSPVPLQAYAPAAGEAWLESLPTPERPLAAALLDEFGHYLHEWGWLIPTGVEAPPLAE